MRSLILNIIILFASGQYLFAQNAGIRGVVIDEYTKQSIEFASVVVFKTADTAILAGTLAKANGSFAFSKLPAGNHLLKIVFIGYQSLVKSVPLSDAEAQSDLGIITLRPARTQLDQIDISGRRTNALSNKIDKQTYRAGQFESARGGTAIDVLKNLPSVAVNAEGSISVRGSSGFLVLVNGKPVLTDARTVLNQLPANSLQSIELITSPSAKYDPDGKGGIINITTKKGVNDGLTLTANAQYGPSSINDHNNKENPKRFGGDVLLNYRHDKWDISVGGN